MLYVTPGDLTNQVTARALEGIDETRLQWACSTASGEADSYLGSRFQLPLTKVGDELKGHVAAIAIWKALAARGFNPNEGANEVIRLGYEDAIRWLKGIASGLINPPDGAYVDSSGNASGGSAGSPKVVSMTVDRNTGLPVVATPRPRGW